MFAHPTGGMRSLHVQTTKTLKEHLSRVEAVSTTMPLPGLLDEIRARSRSGATTRFRRFTETKCSSHRGVFEL